MLKLLDRLSSIAKNASQKPLLRGTFWKLAASVSKLFIQSFYFLIIAKSLGTEQYGLFVGVMALVKLLVPFASWGTPHILMKHVSRDRTVFNVYWGNSLSITVLLGLFFLVSVLLFNHFFLDAQFAWALILSIGLAELVFARIHDAASKAFMATDNLKFDAQINVLLSVNGLIAALGLIALSQQASAITWGWLYLASRLITALISFFLISRIVGWPKLNLALFLPEVRQGFYFSVSLSSQAIYTDIDKTMLASMSTLAATGIYGAAYRILDVAMIPILAVVGASYAHFFRNGAIGIRGSLAFAKRIVPFAGVYGFLATAGVWLVAPLIPLFLGEEYGDAINALRWLSPIIFLKSLQFFAADTLTGAGLQGTRSALQIFAASANGILNFWLIPLYSWKGAAWSSLATDGALVFCLWGLVWFYARRDTQQLHL
jgi:O-antigen/teichoic acid export membrane protein